MRNLFDQYVDPENRLTHALAASLDLDRALLKRFLGWTRTPRPYTGRRLSIVEQTLPGDPPPSGDLTEPGGLPDIVIHDGQSWCVLVESKIGAPLKADQLVRHERTLRRRGFKHITCVALTKDDVRQATGIVYLKWSDLYERLGKIEEREWPGRLREYLRVAEVRMTQEGYLKEGTLTAFDGFKFSPNNPYTYGEAKRLLKLAMRELRANPSLRDLGIDAKSDGRTAIRGRTASNIWDLIPLKDRPAGKDPRRFPHLTLALHFDHLEAAVTIPNQVLPAVRSRLAELGEDRLVALHSEILNRGRKLISRGASIQAYALQRHYPSQSSSGIVDARALFALETSRPTGRGPVKHQPEWVTLFASLLRNKRSNLQFGYLVRWPWETRGLASRVALQLIAESWRALRPLLDRLRAAPVRRRGY